LDSETAALVAQRDRARADGRYHDADVLRETLEAQGWVVEDGTEGTRLYRRSDPQRGPTDPAANPPG
jgi:cysteinyl-tRNA synthetase